METKRGLKIDNEEDYDLINGPNPLPQSQMASEILVLRQ
jgi:hypothetical protein